MTTTWEMHLASSGGRSQACCQRPTVQGVAPHQGSPGPGAKRAAVDTHGFQGGSWMTVFCLTRMLSVLGFGWFNLQLKAWGVLLCVCGMKCSFLA